MAHLTDIVAIFGGLEAGWPATVPELSFRSMHMPLSACPGAARYNRLALSFSNNTKILPDIYCARRVDVIAERMRYPDRKQMTPLLESDARSLFDVLLEIVVLELAVKKGPPERATPPSYCHVAAL